MYRILYQVLCTCTALDYTLIKFFFGKNLLKYWTFTGFLQLQRMIWILSLRFPTAGCNQKCRAGVCQGNELQSQCSCDQRNSIFQAPRCTGHCVVSCPRPDNFIGDWETSCEGSVVCTCNNAGSDKNGIPAGAICR